MKTHKYLTPKNEFGHYGSTNTNIGQLLKRAREEEIGEKRKNIYMAAAAISVLALSGFVISQ